MKNLLTILLLSVGLFLVGCSNDSSLVGPTGTDITNQSVQTQGDSFIGIPSTSLDKSKKVKKEINGKKGGTIEIEGELKNGIEFEAKLVIPKGAFKGTKKITIKFNKKSAAFDLGPNNATFDKPLLLSAEIKGLNLKNIDPNDVQFGFLDKKGNLVPVVYEKMKVDVEDGELKVKNAQLWHFSRYGWAK
jgi:hypothetical protein